LPLYEYECPDCGTFEIIQKFSESPLSTCPTCGKPVEKLLSAPAIQFKGTGWYVTDYARKGQAGKDGGKDGGKESSAKAETATSTSSSKDSSPKTTTSTNSSASSGSSSTK